MDIKRYLTTSQAGSLLGLSRTQVFRLVKAGKIPSTRIGKNYLINQDDLGITDKEVSKQNIKKIKDTVKRVMREYGDVIKKLGEE